MSASIQSQVMAYAVAQQTAAGLNAQRCQMAAFNPAQLPATNTLPDEGEVEYLDTDSLDRKFRFRVRYIAQAVNQVDMIVDLVYVTGNKAIMADPFMGGLVRFTREVSQKWEFEKGEVDTVALAVTYEVEFATSRSDPSVQAA